MNADTQSAREDLAFLRQLVDEDDGGRPLWIFGASYLAIGLAIIAQVVALWIIAADLVPAPEWAPLAAIVAVWTVYTFAQQWIAGRVRGVKPGANVRSRVGGAALYSMALPHLTMVVVFAITAWRQQDGIFLQQAALVFFALQGGMWFIIHALRRERWHLLEAIAWLLATLAAAPFLGTDTFGPVIAIIVLALMVAPGIYMLRVAGRPVQ
jgi:hypothetical protein